MSSRSFKVVLKEYDAEDWRVRRGLIACSFGKHNKTWDSVVMLSPDDDFDKLRERIERCVCSEFDLDASQALMICVCVRSGEGEIGKDFHGPNGKALVNWLWQVDGSIVAYCSRMKIPTLEEISGKRSQIDTANPTKIEATTASDLTESKFSGAVDEVDKSIDATMEKGYCSSESDCSLKKPKQRRKHKCIVQ